MNPIRFILNSCSTVRATMVPLALLGATGLSHAATSANLLVDPGFETQAPMGSFNYASVTSNFTTGQGLWATENGVFVGAENGVSPFGTRMLKMTQANGVTTSTIQMVNLSAFASDIATGTATFNMSNLFNTSATSVAPSAGIFIEFFAGPSSWGTPIGSSFTNSLVLDTNPATWQSIASSGTIPVGAGWVGVQVVFGNTNLGGSAGYVDSNSIPDRPTGFTVITVPEPSSTILLGLGASVLLLRRRV